MTQLNKQPIQHVYTKKRRLGFLVTRATWVSRIVFLLFFTVTLRALYIHVFVESSLLHKIADSQYTNIIHLAPYRGTIFDRRKSPLAISVRAPSIAINPKVFSPTKEERHTLQSTLKISESELNKIAKKQSHFAWLKRKISPTQAKIIEDLELSGLHVLLEPARYYPANVYASPLIGYVGYDNTGLLGLERQLDSYLRGESIDIRHAVDAKGAWIFTQTDQPEPQMNGNEVFLTLDQVMQEIAEDALSTWVEAARAKRGFAIVSDPHTGQILALANYPRFNPNDTSHLKMEDTENIAVTYAFEPGSVVKPFLVAQVLEENPGTENEIHNCEKSGRLRLGKSQVIHDDHPREFLTTAEVLIRSSNICIYKIADKMGREKVSQAFTSFGLAGPTPILPLPGASHGGLSSWTTWRSLRFANISFGQGFMVTGLEMVAGYNSLANGGKRATPYLIEKITNANGSALYQHTAPDSDPIVSFETARTLRSILHRVTLEGTAPLAKTPSYTTGGKTGTAQKVDPITHTYGKDKRIASFIGFAPVDDPRLVVYVVIDEPQEKPYYGGKWAAPAFSEIVERSLKYMNVPSDIPPPEKREAGKLKKDSARDAPTL
jgi:cell division protein FtsI (penicillin-binding protein 3)